MKQATQLPSTISQAVRLGLVAAFILSISTILHADSVELTWRDNSDNEDGFNIERAVGDGSFVSIAETSANQVQYVDDTAEAGVDYRYRVNAFNAFGYSGYTNIVSQYINVVPELTELATVEVEENQTAEAISFTVSDFETDASSLEVTVESDNQDLIGDAGIQIAGSGAERSLALTPNLNVAGEATISISVSDGEDLATRTFLFVVSGFAPPTIELLVDSVAGQVRADESFGVTTTVSDDSLVSSVSYLLDGELIDTKTSAPYTLNFSVPETGTYSLKAVASLVGRDETVEDLFGLDVGAAPSSTDLVEKLNGESVEGTSSNSEATYNLVTDKLTLTDDVGQIGGTSDSHYYHFVRASGDVSLEAKLSDLSTTSGSSVAGLMVRSALYGKSAQVSLLVDSNSNFSIRVRDSRGAETQSVLMQGFSSETWLRLVKTDSSVKLYTQVGEASDWILLSDENIALEAKSFIGFALAGAGSQMATVQFSQAEFSGEIIEPSELSTEPAVPGSLIITSLDN